MRKIKRLGRQNGVSVLLEAKRGKGSHATLHFGQARTVIQDLKKELPQRTFRAMLEQLGLAEADLN